VIDVKQKVEEFFYFFNALKTEVNPCSRELLQKLMTDQLIKKFTVIYGTQRFITMLKVSTVSCVEPYRSRPHQWPLSFRFST
jgi:hypothetical protein